MNSIGLPYYREVLSSSWPDLPSDVGAPPSKYDTQFLSGLKATEFGLYGRNTRGLRRNQLEDTRNVNKSVSSGLKAPKFLSEKARELATSTPKASDDRVDELGHPLAEMEIESKKSEVPVIYRNVEIKYSKFGVDDFDFGSAYSRLLYLGMMTDLTQLLQPNPVLWTRDPYLEFVRQLATSNYALYTCDPEPCSSARCHCVCGRDMPAL